jgi:hypothetical protein
MGTPTAGSVVLVPFPFPTCRSPSDAQRWCWPVLNKVTGYYPKLPVSRIEMIVLSK